MVASQKIACCSGETVLIDPRARRFLTHMSRAVLLTQWLPLENVKTGMIHLRAIWLHLSKDPNDLDKVSNRDRGRGQGSEALGWTFWVREADVFRDKHGQLN